MKRVKKLVTPPTFLSFSALGGFEESRGPLGKFFDLCDPSDRFGQDSFEMSEGELMRQTINVALSKAHLSHTDIDLVIGGDLQNQCVASSSSVSSFGLPFLGIYGACSTATEALLIGSAMIECGAAGTVLCATSSHNSAAERQFRTPLEYGAQRTPSAQWTSTASGAFILCSQSSPLNSAQNAPIITEFMPGRIISGATTDSTNMGAAMSFAALDSILSYFEESGRDASDFDLIVTGDLGFVGSELLRTMLYERLPMAAEKHADCGCLLYDKNKSDVHSGASGCGTSAAVLACHFLPLLRSGELKRILFLSTGALMSPSAVLQGNDILGVAPLIVIEGSN